MEHGCAGAKGYGMFWHPPGGGATAGPRATATTPSDDVVRASRGRVLGGEASLWTDDYCDGLECGAWANRFGPDKLANASCLYARDQDENYAKSLGALAWPRGFVAAGAFYGYDYLNVTRVDAQFEKTIDAITARIQARGGLVCSAGANCDYMSEANARYDGLPPSGNGCYGGVVE